MRKSSDMFVLIHRFTGAYAKLHCMMNQQQERSLVKCNVL